MIVFMEKMVVCKPSNKGIKNKKNKKDKPHHDHSVNTNTVNCTLETKTITDEIPNKKNEIPNKKNEIPNTKNEILNKKSEIPKEKNDSQFVPKPEEYDKNWKILCQSMGISSNPKGPKAPKIEHESKKRKKHVSDSKEDMNNKKEDEIWFDDVDEVLLPMKLESKPSKIFKTSQDYLVKAHSFEGLTKAVAIDCEMVGIGEDGIDNMLARVSIVNQFGHCILDRYVKNTEPVTDYRTKVSGITEELLETGGDFKSVQKEVNDIIKGRILVGHALKNDFQVLYLDHPRKKIRDTQRYKPFRNEFNGRLPSLKKLTARLLDIEIQDKAHSSVEDAQATMRLYTMYKSQWESSIAKKKKEK